MNENGNWIDRRNCEWEINGGWFLISEGYQVIDADKVVRQLQEPGGKLYKAIVETYGLDFIADNGQLNREKLEL